MPVTGEAIEYNEDEQAAINGSLREFYENNNEATNNKLCEWILNGRYEQMLSELRKQDISAKGPEDEETLIDDRLRAETETSYFLRGLKRAAYTRYADEEIVSAAKTCIKALGATNHLKRTAGYSGDGEAEIMFMLAHIHACGGKFRVAKNCLISAKEAASRDAAIIREGLGGPRPFPQDYNVSRSVWNANVAALEERIKSKAPPNPISNLSQAEFKDKGGRINSWTDARVPPGDYGGTQ